MSRTLELPDPLYRALEDAASASGLSPVGWIAARLAGRPSAAEASLEADDAGSLADLFAGRIGTVASGGAERLSEASGDDFAAHLEQKRKAGRL